MACSGTAFNSPNKKHKVTEGRRVFKKNCVLYIFVEFKSKVMCFICTVAVAEIKENNIKGHYDTKHRMKYNVLERHFRLTNLVKSQAPWTAISILQ
jgi:hypothetical protein